MKICTKCKMKKSLDSFGKDSRLKSKKASACLGCKREKSRQYYRENTEACLQSTARWASNNIEYNRARWRSYGTLHKETRKEKSKQYRKNNPEYFAKKAMDRKAKKLQATPIWASHTYLELWYKLAKLEETRTGRKVHVDHIVPLQGKNVCGLHYEHNMQLLFAEDNRAKSNSHVSG